MIALSPRRWVCLAAILGLIGVPWHGASAAPIDDLIAEATALQAQMENNAAVVEQLTERYNAAVIERADAQARVVEYEARIAKQATRLRALQRDAGDRAAVLYKRAGHAQIAERSDLEDPDTVVMVKYGTALVDHDRERAREIERIQETLVRAHTTVVAARQQIEDRAAEIVVTRGQVEQADTLLRSIFVGTKADLAALIQQRFDDAERASLVDAFARTYHADDSTPPTAEAAQAVRYALDQVGKPYVYAAAGPDSFDCSGLTMMAWKTAGVVMPHYAAAEYARFPKVAIDALRPGDLVLFYDDLHHVGMYIGGGRMVNAPRTGEKVKISSIFRTSLAGAAWPQPPSSTDVARQFG